MEKREEITREDSPTVMEFKTLRNRIRDYQDKVCELEETIKKMSSISAEEVLQLSNYDNMTHFIIDSLLDQFEKSGSENFISMDFEDDKGERYEVVFSKLSGESRTKQLERLSSDVDRLELLEKKAFWWASEFTHTVHSGKIQSAWEDYLENSKRNRSNQKESAANIENEDGKIVKNAPDGWSFYDVLLGKPIYIKIEEGVYFDCLDGKGWHRHDSYPFTKNMRSRVDIERSVSL